MNKKRDAASPNEGAGKKLNVKSNLPSPRTQPQGFLSKLWAAKSNNVVSQDSGEESSSDESTQSVHSEKRVSASSNTPREMVSYAQAANTSQDARRSDSPFENNQRGDSKPNENLPIPSKKWTLPKYSVETDGPIRQRLEVEFRTLNGKPFKGTITLKESKHEIFHKILGFEYSNFYGLGQHGRMVQQSPSLSVNPQTWMTLRTFKTSRMSAISRWAKRMLLKPLDVTSKDSGEDKRMAQDGSLFKKTGLGLSKSRVANIKFPRFKSRHG